MVNVSLASEGLGCSRDEKSEHAAARIANPIKPTLSMLSGGCDAKLPYSPQISANVRKGRTRLEQVHSIEASLFNVRHIGNPREITNPLEPL